VRAALLAASRLADSGRDLGRFFGDLEAHARALMVVQALGELPAELRVTPEQDERLAAQAATIAPIDVVRLLELIAAALRAMKDGADARTQLDLVLVKAAEPAHDPSAKALLARIERLEGRAPAVAPPRDPAQPATAAGRTKVAVSAQVEGEPVTATTTTPGTPDSSAAEAQAVADETAAAVSEELDAPATAIAVVDPDASAAEPSVELSLDAFAAVWPAVLESIAAESPMLAAMLSEARPTALADQDLTLAWPESASFSKRQAEEPAKRELIAQSIRAVTGASLRLAYELGAEHEAPAAQISDDELVERFKREFEAEELPPSKEEES
jgi:DNA polymerase-3 subunit gamma/tau